MDHKQITELAIKKCVNRLWYYEEVILFSLFNDRLEYKSKSRIAKRVIKNINEDNDMSELQIEVLKQFKYY